MAALAPSVDGSLLLRHATLHRTSLVTHHFAELLGHADPGAVESPADADAAPVAVAVKVDRGRKREGAGDRLSAAANGGEVGGLPPGRRVNFVGLHHHDRRHMTKGARGTAALSYLGTPLALTSAASDRLTDCEVNRPAARPRPLSDGLRCRTKRPSARALALGLVGGAMVSGLP